MSTYYFDIHVREGFDLGWSRKIPEYTPEDWGNFLAVAYKAWRLENMREKLMSQAYADIYDSLPSELIHSFGPRGRGASDPRDVVRLILENMISPIGKLDFYAGFRESLLTEAFENAFHKKWSEQTRRKFLAGLRLAAEQPIADYYLLKLRTQLSQPEHPEDTPSTTSPTQPVNG